MLLSPTLQKTLSPPASLRINLLNAQKPDKREMEPDSCQFIKRLKKWFILPRSQTCFSQLSPTMHWGVVCITQGQEVMRQEKQGERKRNGGNVTDSLELLVWSQTTHHTKWETRLRITQKSYHKNHIPPKDGRSDLKHQTCPQTDTHRASWAKLPLAGRHLSLSHPSSKVSYKSGAVSQSCGFLSE